MGKDFKNMSMESKSRLYNMKRKTIIKMERQCKCILRTRGVKGRDWKTSTTDRER